MRSVIILYFILNYTFYLIELVIVFDFVKNANFVLHNTLYFTRTFFLLFSHSNVFIRTMYKQMVIFMIFLGFY